VEGWKGALEDKQNTKEAQEPQGTEESYLTVMLAKFIAQTDLVLNSKQ